MTAGSSWASMHRMIGPSPRGFPAVAGASAAGTARYAPMPTIVDLVEDAALEVLTGRDALSAGRALALRGSVTIVAFGPERVVAEVVDRGARAHVELAVAGSTLDWSCDCRRGAAAGACRHVAATGIETRRHSSRRRS